MAEEFYTTLVYRLRASSPMPVAESVGGYDFVLHTFGAEQSEVTIYECTRALPRSGRFRGQGGDLVRASFSRIGDREGHFQGRTEQTPDYIDEDELGFNYPS